jgi:hypothetical protein
MLLAKMPMRYLHLAHMLSSTPAIGLLHRKAYANSRVPSLSTGVPAENQHTVAGSNDMRPYVRRKHL